MTTFSIRYETSNSCRLVGIVNNAPTAGDALEVWALANGLRVYVEVDAQGRPHGTPLRGGARRSSDGRR